MASDGAAACVQINFTPLGARLALGLPMHELASRMVPLDDLAGDRPRRARGPARRLPRLGWAAGAGRSLGRCARPGRARRDPGVAAALRTLGRTGGTARVAALADRLGWSRKRLVARFREEVGLPPKAVARILRFRRAERMAAAGRPDWADIAAACGYSDQSHLVREFRALAGAAPTAWAAAQG